jgi:hypothetical protein
VLGIGGIPLIVGDPDTQLGVLIVESALVVVAVASLEVVRRSRGWRWEPAEPNAPTSGPGPMSSAAPDEGSPRS